MTVLSVNLNKIALLRNSRGRDFPNVVDYAGRFLTLGAGGITIHPRPDERHIKYEDARRLGHFIREHHPSRELNIEGYPAADFMALIREVRPHQCTLVPDAPGQLTSDHGWDCRARGDELRPVLEELRSLGVRSSVFLDPDPEQAPLAGDCGADRIELYTEDYARAFGTAAKTEVLERYRRTAGAAQNAGVGVNAGHDLDLGNLGDFLAIPAILEVSIGHALTVECIDQGMETVMQRYLSLCHEHR